MSNHGGARPKRRPDDKRGGARTTAHPNPKPRGPKSRILTLDLGKETLATLRLLAAAQDTTMEALAAGWVKERATREWEEYDKQVSCLEEEWEEGELL